MEIGRTWTGAGGGGIVIRMKGVKAAWNAFDLIFRQNRGGLTMWTRPLGSSFGGRKKKILKRRRRRGVARAQGESHDETLLMAQSLWATFVGGRREGSRRLPS